VVADSAIAIDIDLLQYSTVQLSLAQVFGTGLNYSEVASFKFANLMFTLITTTKFALEGPTWSHCRRRLEKKKS